MHYYTLSVILQVICAVHCFKTYRNLRWLWLIFFFPLVGCLVYFICEILPDLQAGVISAQTKKKIPKNPQKYIEYLKEEISFRDTIENRTNLAEAYVQMKRFTEAVDVYKSCLEGTHNDDFYILLGLAYAYFKNEQYQEALVTLEAIDQQNTNEKIRERKLLEAQSYEHLKQFEEALAIYQATIHATGEEVRCRCALLLLKMEREDEARKLFEEILINAKRANGPYRKSEHQWIDAARKMVDQLK